MPPAERQGALATAVASDLPRAAVRTLNNLGVVLESRDRYAAVSETTERGLELARRAGDRVWEVTWLSGAVSGLVLIGRWEESSATEAEALQLESESEHPALLHLVAVDCARGDLAWARARLERVPGLREADEVQARASYLLHEAMLLRAEGKSRAALEALDEALAAQRELGVTYLTIKLAVVEALEAAFELGETARLDELLALAGPRRRGGASARQCTRDVRAPRREPAARTPRGCRRATHRSIRLAPGTGFRGASPG